MEKWQITGFLAVLIIGFLLISGCTQDNDKYCRDNFPGTVYSPSSKMCERGSNIVVKGYWEISGTESQSNPIPVKTHLDVVNTGDSDGKNVQIEVEFLYNNSTVKTETVYFGTIKGGDSKTKDEVIFMPRPKKFDMNFLDMHFSVYVNGDQV
jgi:hypothetical protein